MIDDKKIEEAVLILVVVDDGLVLLQCLCTLSISLGLNPYCSGRWPRTLVPVSVTNDNGES